VVGPSAQGAPASGREPEESRLSVPAQDEGDGPESV